MTTNQTIDGVPRHTLRLALAGIEYLALRADDIGTSSVQLAAELRALLDAPVPFPGYPPVPEDRKLPSAQPQGEPVAWMQPGQGGMCISNEVKLHSLKMGGAPASAVSGYSVPLYAGQPAPVAAVPEGWQMVPVAPTDDMIVAFAEAWYSKHQTIDDPSMLEAYHDMLVVAPTYPRQQ